MQRIILACTWLLLVAIAAPSVRAAPSIPAPLAPWTDWVLHGHEHRRCPWLLGHSEPSAEAARICAWPGTLELRADATGARFTLDWTALIEQPVPLPGDARQRPLDVQVDGRPAAVALQRGVPTLRLAPGRHRIEGRFAWARRPERLAVPSAVGLVALAVDGQPVALPERDERHLWLGRSQVETVGQDSLTLRVHRLLADGVPLRLSTDLQLEVSGRAREAALGQPLPDGFAPVALQSPLPAAIGPDGVLRVQLRPGSWRLRLDARALDVADRFAPRANPAPWPREEIWSFRAAAALRSVQAVGERPVDPNQVGAPWGESLPTFVLGAGDTLAIEQRSRGLDPERPDRLTLDRALWIDHDGGGLTALDRINGRLAAPGRLDMRAPWALRHAQADGEPLLVTTSDGANGVELRRRNVALTTLARRADLSGPIGSGWAGAFDAMSLTVQLPPGWRLLHVGGADRAPAAWLAQWTLLDLFLLALATLLAFRLFGLPFALLVLGYLLLGYHESGVPLWTVIGAMLAALLARLLPAGRLQRVVAAARTALLLLALLWTLPFAAGQLKLALYPQLECDRVGGRWDDPCGFDGAPTPMPQVAFEAPMMEKAAAPAPAPRSVTDRGRLIAEAAAPPPPQAPPAPPPPPLDAYPSDAIVQAGPGMPDWSWRRAEIGIDGPVAADQSLRLWLSPPWLTGAWRIALVALLAAVLGGFAGRAWRLPSLRPAGNAAAALLVATLCWGPSAEASDYPPQPMLDALRERLLEAPRCAPDCASVARAAVRVDRERLSVQLELHAQAELALPLPDPGRAAALDTVRLDGDRSAVARRDNAAWLRVPRGVHRVELDWRLGGGDTVDLRFPLVPAAVAIAASGWDSGGLQDGRLLGDTLQLLRQAQGPAVEGAEPSAPAIEFPPFVQVTRRITLGLDWHVTTEVRRVAPAQAGFTVPLPLIAGERVLDDSLVVDGGEVRVAFAAGQDRVGWRSQLPIEPQLALSAGPLARAAERWQVQVGPTWHLTHAGVPEIDAGDDSALQFQPLPGETLQLSVSRPAAIDGVSIAIDRARLNWHPGERIADANLAMTIRSTRGGPHPIGLPADAELVGVQRDGESLPLRLVDGRLTLPLLPGEQSFAIDWRQPRDGRTVLRTPALELGADAANITIELTMPQRRWLLAAFGGGVGPAVLYWPQLLLMLLVAWGLSRTTLTPLRFHHWLLLGIGFSTVSWLAAAIVGGWLLALGARAAAAARVGHLPRIGFALLQLALLAFTVVALLCLVAAIPYGLLGTPDMHVVGNGSFASRLLWFFDRSAGAVPTVVALSLPLWLYKLALLLWALWLANALIGWLRWGWQSLSAGGVWPPRRAAAAAPPAAAPPADRHD